MRIEVQHTFGNIAKQLQKLQDDIQNKGLAQTVNAFAFEAQRNMATEIAAEFNITRREAFKYLRIDKATAKAGGRWLIARLYAPLRKKGRGFNLIRFVEKKVTFAEMRRRKKAGTLAQLRVQIKRGGGPGAGEIEFARCFRDVVRRCERGASGVSQCFTRCLELQVKTLQAICGGGCGPIASAVWSVVSENGRQATYPPVAGPSQRFPIRGETSA